MIIYDVWEMLTIIYLQVILFPNMKEQSMEFFMISNNCYVALFSSPLSKMEECLNSHKTIIILIAIKLFSF